MKDLQKSNLKLNHLVLVVGANRLKIWDGARCAVLFGRSKSATANDATWLKEAKSMKHIFIFVFLALFALEIPKAFGGDSFYYEQRLRLGKSSTQVLIKHGLCTDDNDCGKKNLVGSGGMYSGVHLVLYDMHDLPAIKEIIGLCMDEYEKNAEQMSILVEVYREKHDGAVGLINSLSTNPYIKLHIKGEI